jgi:serine/threonine protein kinase
MSLVPGTRLRDYEIKSLIGKGGMGEVYLAEETTLGRKVAIKMLKPEATTDPRFVERFRNEARVLGHLNHPNIVALYSFFEDGGAYYLVMQYAPGITLAELIRRTGPIPEQRATRIFSGIGEALAFAHSEGIIHRDIKPSNIMIDPDKNDRVLVMDFGIARMIDAQHITRTGTQMGTPCYMSPEQVLGEKEIDHRSDIYSAGVVLYEMLSGSIPYDMDTESLFKIQNRIVSEPLPDPRLKYEYIGVENVALIDVLTRKDPKDRPDSILDALKTTPPTPGPVAQKPVPEKPKSREVNLRQEETHWEPPVLEDKPKDSWDYFIRAEVPARQKAKLKKASLILLPFLIIGLLVVFGLELRRTHKFNENKMAIANDANNYATEIIQMWKTPVSMGGAGSNTFKNTMKQMEPDRIAAYLGIGTSESNAVANSNGKFYVYSVHQYSIDELTVTISGIGRAVRKGMSPSVTTRVSLPSGEISSYTDECLAYRGD